MTTHGLTSFRFSHSTNSIQAVADWLSARAVISRWRRWLVVALLAGSAGTSRAQLANGGFDAATLSPGQYQYYAAQSQPVDSWTYAGAAGLATDSSNKANFATGYPGVYAGTNYAFLQTATGNAGSNVQLLVPDQYAVFMVPNSSLDIMNPTGQRWYFFSDPTPAPAHMSRMDSSLVSETPWDSPEFDYAQDQLLPGEFLRVYSESVPTNTTISIPFAFSPLGQQLYFNIRVGDSPFVQSINLMEPSPSAAANARWQVTLSVAVDGVSSSNFGLFNPNGISNPAITSVIGSGSNWIVTASTGTGYGLLGLNWVGTAAEQPSVPVKFTGQMYEFSAVPIITENPVSVTSVVGTPVTLHGSASLRSGGTPTYQWFEGNNQFPGSAVAVSGATSPDLALPATTNDYTRTFFLRAYNGPGAHSDSLNTTVRIVFPPAITPQPADQVVFPGQTATLSVGVSGTPPLSYQWYSGLLGDISNPVGTNSSHTPTTPPLGANATFWVQVRNDAGANYAVTSRLASVTILNSCDDP